MSDEYQSIGFTFFRPYSDVEAAFDISIQSMHVPVSVNASEPFLSIPLIYRQSTSSVLLFYLMYKHASHAPMCRDDEFNFFRQTRQWPYLWLLRLKSIKKAVDLLSNVQSAYETVLKQAMGVQKVYKTIEVGVQTEGVMNAIASSNWTNVKMAEGVHMDSDPAVDPHLTSAMLCVSRQAIHYLGMDIQVQVWSIIKIESI